MKALTFEMFLEQPVIVSQPSAGEENSTVSANYIPGSALRGAFIALFLNKHPGIDVSQSIEHRRWFFTGDNAFLNGYPILWLDKKNNQRALPTPLSWQVSKDDRSTDSARIYDFAIENEPDLDTPVLPAGDFAIIDSATSSSDCMIFNSKQIVIPHNTSLKRQIKKADDSMVFHHEALAPNQRFIAAIVGPDALSIKENIDLVDGMIITIGASKSATYGRVRIESIKCHDDWHEVQTPPANNGNNIVVTLTSDLIIRSSSGQPSVTPMDILSVKPLYSVYKTRIAGGFNRKWRLPLPQSVVLQAGSVFIYQSELKEKLLQLEECGLGERRAEGFGRFVMNWNIFPTLRRVPLKNQITIASEPVQPLSIRSQELARTIQIRRLKSELDHQLINNISRFFITDPPKTSQLSQIVELSKNSVISTDLDPLRIRLQDMKRTARDAFEKSQVEGDRGPHNLLEWLDTGFSEDFSSNFWRFFLPLPTETEESFTAIELSQLKSEYIARFITGLLKLTIRRIQEQNKTKPEAR